MAEIKRMFTPEFRNRLDAIDLVRALDHEVILRVVDKFLLQLEAQLHEKKVEAIVHAELRKYLAKKGFDPQMGARPMARLIQDTIRKALADELLFGRLHGRRARDDRPSTTRSRCSSTSSRCPRRKAGPSPRPKKRRQVEPLPAP